MMCKCYGCSDQQRLSLAFDPTAEAIQPSNPIFIVKYSLKFNSKAEIQDDLVSSNFTIEVSALGAQTAVS